jgi:hypothetical protein
MVMHLAGKVHQESREAARAEVWRTNGEPVRLLYEIEICSDTTP